MNNPMLDLAKKAMKWYINTTAEVYHTPEARH